MKRFFPILLLASLEVGCGNASTSQNNSPASQQSPIKVDLIKKPDERIRITSVDSQVTIEGVTANRGNCSVITGDTAVGARYLMAVGLTFQKLAPTLNLSSEEQSVLTGTDTEKQFLLITKYVKDPSPPYPQFPQEIRFGEAYFLGYMCQRVIEVEVSTNHGNWTFTWN